jgi:hypothetical protein
MHRVGPVAWRSQAGYGKLGPTAHRLVGVPLRCLQAGPAPSLFLRGRGLRG